MKPESLGVSLSKLVLTVSIIVSLGALFGTAGYFTTHKFVSAPIQPQISTSPTPTPDIKDETADLSSKVLATEDWKTYRNEKYGFKFKYPEDFDLDEPAIAGNINDMDSTFSMDLRSFKTEPNGHDWNSAFFVIQNHNKPASLVSIGFASKDEILNAKKGKGIDAALEQAYAGKKGILTYKDKETYGREEAGRVVEISLYYTVLLSSEKNDYDYSIQFIIPFFENAKVVDAPQDRKFIDIFNQIISTFKFTDKESFSCGTSTVADVDRNTYNTVQIGTQCWMKENLKVTKNPEGKLITRYCYNNDPKICDTDGGLYDWNTAMNGSTEEGVQGICPDGWHVPKDSEWYILEKGLATGDCDGTRTDWGCEPAGIKLSQRGPDYFEVISAGYRDGNGYFYDRNKSAYFWSSTDIGRNNWVKYRTKLGEQVFSSDAGYHPWLRYLLSNQSGLYRDPDDNGDDGFSVRCLKN